MLRMRRCDKESLTGGEREEGGKVDRPCDRERRRRRLESAGERWRRRRSVGDEGRR